MSLQGSSFNVNSFYEKLGGGQLTVVRCRDCSNYLMPPSPICSRCMSGNLEWVPLSRKGRVISFSEVHVSTDNFKKDLPYVVAIVEMDGEGHVRLPGVIRGATRSDIEIGSRVALQIEPRPSEKWPHWPRYYFLVQRGAE
ncbi:MAG TPA: Zn-ribbon domain-containing OB-fold protein [Nitrososphaerales archaeon]|nr:Zn-ribbon domain-containing OB-fold protein [Nitrososphaerales archaeon]